jgi:AraC family transcriptional regulator, transcriptional activator of pobA
MQLQNFSIPVYKAINDFLISIPSNLKTNNPNFFCFHMKPFEGSIANYKPPFKKDFYFISLITNAGNTKITYDSTNVTELNSFLVFQSPGLLYSFMRDNRANGYLIYFKKELFSFFKPEFEKEFPFFNIIHTNFYKLNQAKFKSFAPHFKDVIDAYENSIDSQHIIATMKLLALLYQLKEFTTAFTQWEQGFTSPQQILFQKFTQLVNNFYLEKRTIEEYSELLFVTPNHLSQSIKAVSDKNALSFINERLMTEAKSMVQFSTMDIAEIAYQLNFSDPANFGKFFKKYTEITPMEYRKQHLK